MTEWERGGTGGSLFAGGRAGRGRGCFQMQTDFRAAMCGSGCGLVSLVFGSRVGSS